MTDRPTGSSASSRLVDEAREACRIALESLAGSALAPEVAALRSRLDAPLRVAIAGRVKAGKSTLLNALVGERLAPTDAGECTRLVTVYREAIAYDVTAVLRDGRQAPLPFRRVEGALRIDLGPLPVEAVERLEVGWPSSALRSLTLIDTPGLASVNDENSLRTREFLALEEGRSGEADAVIYLMRHMHRTDGEFLDAFLDRSVGNVSPVNAITVLSRADEIGAGRLDAMTSASRIAARYRGDQRLQSLSATVLPIAGLIAETGLTFREREAAALRAIAALDTDALRLLLLSVDRFVELDAPVTREVRRDLLDRLGMFGLRLCVSALKTGRAGTAAELSSLLVDASGLPELRRVLAEHFLPRAQVLKSRSVLAGLRRLAARARASDPAAAAAIDRAVERITASAHEFAELRLAHLAMTGAARLDDADRSEVERLTLRHDAAERLGLSSDARPEDRSAAALRSIERWRARAEDPLLDRVTAEAAGIVVRSYEGLYAEARAAAG